MNCFNANLLFNPWHISGHDSYTIGKQAQHWRTNPLIGSTLYGRIIVRMKYGWRRKREQNHLNCTRFHFLGGFFWHLWGSDMQSSICKEWRCKMFYVEMCENSANPILRIIQNGIFVRMKTPAAGFIHFRVTVTACRDGSGCSNVGYKCSDFRLIFKQKLKHERMHQKICDNMYSDGTLLLN